MIRRVKEKDIQERLEEETKLCSMAGQRICLQQFCLDKEAEIKNQLETIMSSEDKYKSIQKDVVEKMIDNWMKGFSFNKPSNLFLDSQDFHLDIMTMIQTERNFFIETLVFYGLNKNYMSGEGHWHDWAEKVAEEKKQ